MPRLFHGTRHADATAMHDDGTGQGSIDVTRGSGEFGKGFYTQTSSSNALTWVQNKFPAGQRPCILQLDVADQQYNGLSKRVLEAKAAARLTRRLRNSSTVARHTEGVDVVTGPLSQWIEQQKFESTTSQTLLNGPDTQRSVV
jgi:hypothetical protein